MASLTLAEVADWLDKNPVPDQSSTPQYRQDHADAVKAFELLSKVKHEPKKQAKEEPWMTEAKNPQPQGVMETVGKWIYGDPRASTAERIAANPAVRFAMGAGAPFIGAAQLAANAVGAGSAINEDMATLDAMKRAGGHEGVDFVGIGGGMASPVATGALSLLPKAAETIGRVGQGVGLGALSGTMEPVTENGDYWGDKLSQIGSGALIGGAVPAGWEALKGTGAAVRNLFQPYMGKWGADKAAGRLANTVAGDKRADILSALDNPDVFVPDFKPTAGEAATRANRPEFSALQAVAAEKNPTLFTGAGGVEGSQNRALIRTVRDIGKDEGAVRDAIAQRSRSTNPILDEVTKQANTAGVKTQELSSGIAAKEAEAAVEAANVRRLGAAQQIAEDVANKQPTLSSEFAANGVPRIAGRYGYGQELANLADTAMSDSAAKSLQRGAEARFKQMQLDSLKQSGLAPLTSDAVTNQIDRVLIHTPGDRAIPLNQKILGAVKNAIQEWTDPATGTIRFEDLHAIRKVGINQIIDELLGKEASGGTKQHAAKLAADVRKDIDNAIIRAIGGERGKSLWEKYLASFSEQSKKIEQMQLGQKMEEKLSTALHPDEKLRAPLFASALRDEPGTIRNALTGNWHRSLEDFMEPHQIGALQSVGKELARRDTNLDMARKGIKSARDLMNVAVPEAPSAGMFDPRISVARAAWNQLRGGATNKTLSDLSNVMHDPKLTAELMRGAEPFKRQTLVDELMRRVGTGAGPLTAVTSQ